MQGYVLGVGMAGIDQVCEGENFKRRLRVFREFYRNHFTNFTMHTNPL